MIMSHLHLQTATLSSRTTSKFDRRQPQKLGSFVNTVVPISLWVASCWDTRLAHFRIAFNWVDIISNNTETKFPMCERSFCLESRADVYRRSYLGRDGNWCATTFKCPPPPLNLRLPRKTAPFLSTTIPDRVHISRRIMGPGTLRAPRPPNTRAVSLLIKRVMGWPVFL